MDAISSFAARYERTREEELSLEDYLAECKRNPLTYATAAERMLAAIGFDSDRAYVAGLTCFHSPGTRLSGDDLEACATLARRHVALAKPKRLLLLGDAPCRARTTRRRRGG